ncbi:hypothetical protein BDB01DRAFT_588737 [Pilobolus umbonatus]|nr:hypothetical protein BDB01DRAFT_588737 [Pilobolus umbonatus]
MFRQKLKLTTSLLQRTINTHLLPTKPLNYVVVSAYSSYTKDIPRKFREQHEHVSSPRPRQMTVDSDFARTHPWLYNVPVDPYKASDKINQILKIGTMDDAYDYLVALPISLQAAPSWNQLISYCAKESRANHAERLYIQMRKRGIKPNDRTFTHLINAYAHSTSPLATTYAEEWLEKMKDFGIEKSVIHINALMKVYNGANRPEKTLQLFKALPAEDIIPDTTTYTMAFDGCALLRHGDPSNTLISLWKEIDNRLAGHHEEHVVNNPSMSVLEQKAHLVALKEAALKNKTALTPLDLDYGLVVSMLSAITRTARRERDIVLGIQIIDKLFSICPPRAAEIMTNNGIDISTRVPGYGIQPTNEMLDAILRFSGGLREYELGVQYLEQTMNQYPRIRPDDVVKNAYKYLKDNMRYLKSSKERYQKGEGNTYKKERENRFQKAELNETENKYFKEEEDKYHEEDGNGNDRKPFRQYSRNSGEKYRLERTFNKKSSRNQKRAGGAGVRDKYR